VRTTPLTLTSLPRRRILMLRLPWVALRTSTEPH
jgi:hypothetical protein